MKSANYYNGVPVIFNNISQSGFLINDGIIRESSRAVECTATSKLLILPNQVMAISRQANNYAVVEVSKLNLDKLHLFQLGQQRSYDHSSLVMEGVDFMSQMVQLTQVEELEGNYFVDKSSLIKTESGVSHILNTLESTAGSFKAWIISIAVFIKLIVISSFVISIVAIAIVCRLRGLCLCPCLRWARKQLRHRHPTTEPKHEEQPEQLEMFPQISPVGQRHTTIQIVTDARLDSTSKISF